MVVCRNKGIPEKKQRDLAKRLQEVCLLQKKKFVISHNIGLAIELGADGIHLGVGDPSITQARDMVGGEITLGYSTHSVLEAQKMFDAGADYIFLGPIYSTPEKLKYGKPLGVQAIKAALDLSGPVVFIGGMDETTIAQAHSLGATRFAAIREFQGGDNPAGRVRSIVKRFAVT